MLIPIRFATCSPPEAFAVYAGRASVTYIVQTTSDRFRLVMITTMMMSLDGCGLFVHIVQSTAKRSGRTQALGCMVAASFYGEHLMGRLNNTYIRDSLNYLCKTQQEDLIYSTELSLYKLY